MITIYSLPDFGKSVKGGRGDFIPLRSTSFSIPDFGKSIEGGEGDFISLRYRSFTYLSLSN